MASASSNGRSATQVRRDIEEERGQLAAALDQLREEIGQAADVTANLRAETSAGRCGGARQRLLLRRWDRRDAALPRRKDRDRRAWRRPRPSSVARRRARRGCPSASGSTSSSAPSSSSSPTTHGPLAQVAFSSLLAFFPAVIFLVGLLDLIDAYYALEGVSRAGRAGRRARDDRDAPAGHRRRGVHRRVRGRAPARSGRPAAR